jgi:ElaB/YqjD/DUF883 family membrane-anchored ribosome-binding protein
MARQNASTDDVADDVGKLRSDMDALRADFATLADHIKQIGGSAMSEARSRGADKVSELRKDLERTADHLREQGEASVAEVERTIQDRPLLSMLAAFGVGMLLTRLLERR